MKRRCILPMIVAFAFGIAYLLYSTVRFGSLEPTFLDHDLVNGEFSVVFNVLFVVLALGYIIEIRCSTSSTPRILDILLRFLIDPFHMQKRVNHDPPETDGRTVIKS